MKKLAKKMDARSSNFGYVKGGTELVTWLEVVKANQRKHEIAYVACFLFVCILFKSKGWICELVR